MFGIFRKKKEPKYYIVDGADSYVKESDIFDVKNSCVKLVFKSSNDEVTVIADDDMFSPMAIYTIKIDDPKELEEIIHMIMSYVRMLNKESKNGNG